MVYPGTVGPAAVTRRARVIAQLRLRIEGEEFDYQTLIDALRAFSKPRDAMSCLLRDRAIIRVKKGLYVFGPAYARRAYSRELLANLIYGPSYVSLDYALQHYGLIPESVHAVTSATTGRSRRFETPLGLFLYRRVPDEGYPVGMRRLEQPEGVPVLMASVEKALADKIYDDRGTRMVSVGRMRSYLLDDLRVDEDDLLEMDPEVMQRVAGLYGSRRIEMASDTIRTARKDLGRHRLDSARVSQEGSA